MAFQRGSLKKVQRKEGATWMLRYRVSTADGRRVEHNLPVGLVRDFPNEKSAWHEVAKQSLHVRINDEIITGRVKFHALAEHYLKSDFGEDALRPKSEKTIDNVTHLVRDYLIIKWGAEIAEDIKPIEIQRYLRHLNRDKGLAWPTVSKIRGVMLRIYKVGILHGNVSSNPVEAVETRSTTDYRAIALSPIQTLAVIQRLPNNLHRMLVVTCAATALRASEILALRWADIRWDENRIRISKRWSKGKDGPTKNEASDGYVPMHPVLAAFLTEWPTQTPFGKDTDFVFPSIKAEGKVPLSPAIFVADHLRKAAKEAGVFIPDGHRFGFHNFRHSLSNWLVNRQRWNRKRYRGC